MLDVFVTIFNLFQLWKNSFKQKRYLRGDEKKYWIRILLLIEKQGEQVLFTRDLTLTVVSLELRWPSPLGGGDSR